MDNCANNKNTKMNFCEYYYNDYKENDDKLFLEFYNNIVSYSYNYDYIVLTTRRCFRLLNSVHKNYSSEESQKVWSKVISSQAIRFNKDLLKDKSVLLVDDIMLHGKAVYSLYFELKNIIKAKRIDTFVLARSNEQPDLYFRSIRKDYYSMFFLTTNLWENLSNRIVRYFCSKGEPYTSYLFDFQFDSQSDVSKFDKSIAKRKAKMKTECNCTFYSVNFDDETFPEFIKSKYYNAYFDFMDLKPSDKNSIIDKIILRKYEYQKVPKIIYIPYCELKSIKSDVLKKSWEKLKERNILVEHDSLYKVDSAIDIYKIYSLLLGLYFWDLGGSSPNLDVEKSYYDGFCNEILQLNEKIKSICPTVKLLNEFLYEIGLEHYNYNDIIFNDSLYSEELASNNLVNNLDDIQKIEKLYALISSISEKEEYRFEERLKKLSNSSDGFDNIHLASSMVPLDFIESKMDNNHWMDASIINLLDVGFLSHVIATFNDGEEFVSVAVKTGEQSYRIPYKLNPIAFICTTKFYDIFTYLKERQLSETDVVSFIKYLKNTFPNEDTIIRMINDNLTNIYQNKLLNVLEKGKELISTEEFKNSKIWINAINKYFIEKKE